MIYFFAHIVISAFDKKFILEKCSTLVVAIELFDIFVYKKKNFSNAESAHVIAVSLLVQLEFELSTLEDIKKMMLFYHQAIHIGCPWICRVARAYFSLQYLY